MIVNLTPHPLHIYPPDTPDRIVAGSVAPLRVLPPSAQHPPARLGNQVIGEQLIDDDIPVALVTFGPREGQVSDLPEPRAGTWYVVSLVVGIAAVHRDDLLVLHEYVRDLDGHVIGSRMLAHPAAAAAPSPGDAHAGADSRDRCIGAGQGETVVQLRDSPHHQHSAGRGQQDRQDSARCEQAALAAPQR